MYRATMILALASLLAGCSTPATNGQGGDTSLIKAYDAGNNGGHGADIATTDSGGQTTAADVAKAGTDANAVAIDTATSAADSGATSQDSGGAGQADTGAGGVDTGAGQADAGTGGTDTAAPPKDTGGSNPTCQDGDGDSYGVGCPAGQDCDDTNPNFAVVCPDCTTGNHAGCACKGVAANCYSGEQAWIGKGVCQAGVQLCKGGFWGECNGESLPTPEVCDGKDNNCNGLIDEGVLSSCGTCDMSCTQQKKGPDYGSGFNPGKDNSNGMGLDKNGYLSLNSKKANIDLHHIWIANSGETSVSKLDTKTGWEVARYKSCGNPSRTAVDLNGDVWVGCRSGGQVMKIITQIKQCPDKNGNGKIETSKDANGDHKISGGEMLGFGADECVRFIVKPNGTSMIRAMGVDKDNYGWAGGWNHKKLYRLHPDTGAVVDSINLGCNPYGLVIDQKGIIWVAGRGCSKLLRADPKTKQVTQHGGGKQYNAYGINVDVFGHIWGGNCCSYHAAFRYNTLTKALTSVKTQGRPRGVATSADGYAFIANDTTHSIAKINAQTLTVEGNTSLGPGRFPVGIAVDFDGFVWAVNQQKSSASKIDPKTMQVVGEYPVGKSPYTYSDMTGYTLNNFTAPKGHYWHTFGFSGWDGTVAENKTQTVWESIDVESVIPAKAYLRVRYKFGNTLASLDKATWSTNLGPFPPATFPIDLKKEKVPVIGKFMQVEIFMQAGKDNLSPLVKSITAKGKQVPIP